MLDSGAASGDTLTVTKGSMRDDGGEPSPGAWHLTYHERLSTHAALHHPHAAERMRASVGLPHLLSCLEPPSQVVEERIGSYVKIRAEQNRLWASESVARGVSLAKAGQTADAIAAYEHAIELDCTHADAYVARGAAFANDERYEKALADFETALRVEPRHPNARAYLDATRARLRAREAGAPTDARANNPTGSTSAAEAAAAAAPRMPAREAPAANPATSSSQHGIVAAAAGGGGGPDGRSGVVSNQTVVSGQTAVLERFAEVLRNAQRSGRHDGERDKAHRKSHRRRDKERKEHKRKAKSDKGEREHRKKKHKVDRKHGKRPREEEEEDKVEANEDSSSSESPGEDRGAGE